MLSFVSFLWRQPGYPTVYTADHVNRWAGMIRRHYSAPHRLICVTDDMAGIGPGIEIVRPLRAHADIGNPHGIQFPSCYRRLRIWADDAGVTFGSRIVLLDLDCTITGDLRPLLDRDDDVVLWRDPGWPAQPYNGGMILLRAGSRPQVWREFDPAFAATSRQLGFKGSDQAWIAHCLGPGEAVWTADDGVLSFKRDVLRAGRLPGHARIVLFHGRIKPWNDEAMRIMPR